MTKRNIILNDEKLFIFISGEKGTVVLSRYINTIGVWSYDYHARNQQYNGQKQESYECDFLENGEKCFCGGRGLRKELSYELDESLKTNSNKIWEYLENQYEILN